ncbi:hypothetical protein [Hymenobacter norwichensis]|uniref:hypothetical protein n=1 Tax=Hymenobacter norwichensis TaxID=223903 RepID=UPI0003B74269|nr:hypothetical protein [Hymenobacter norwichensis]
MTNYFPFEVRFINGALYGSPEQMYQIVVNFQSSEFTGYEALFNKYGLQEGALSLVDLTALIIESTSPDLLDNMDFDEEGYQLDMHIDSEVNLQQLLSVICPVYRDLAELERYIRRVTSR